MGALSIDYQKHLPLTTSSCRQVANLSQRPTAPSRKRWKRSYAGEAGVSYLDFPRKSPRRANSAITSAKRQPVDGTVSPGHPAPMVGLSNAINNKQPTGRRGVDDSSAIQKPVALRPTKEAVRAEKKRFDGSSTEQSELVQAKANRLQRALDTMRRKVSPVLRSN